MRVVTPGGVGALRSPLGRQLRAGGRRGWPSLGGHRENRAPASGPAQIARGAGLIGLGGLIGSTAAETTLVTAASFVLVLAILQVPILGLYALLFAIPFSPTFSLAGLDFSVSAVEPLAFLLLAIWLARRAIGRDAGATGAIPAQQTGLFVALFCLLCTLLIAATGATSATLAIKESLKWILLVFAFVYTAVHVRGESEIRRVLAVLFLAGSAEALYGIAQFALGWGPATFAIGGFMRSHGHFGQPNPFAGYLGTLFPLALAFAATPQPTWFSRLARGAAVCTGVAIALSLSRGSWLGLTFALAVMASVWSPRTRRLVAPTVVGLVLFGLLGMLGLLPPAVATRVTSATSNFGIFDARYVQLSAENHAVVERMAHWQAGWEMFLSSPLRGVGPGNYPAVYERYALTGWPDPLGHAHNYYLNMAAEAGLPGLFALLAVLTLAFRAVLRGLWTDDGRRTTDDARELKAEGSVASTGASIRPSLGADHSWSILHRPSSVLGPPSSVHPPSAAFSRALAAGLLGSLVVFCTHNAFDNLLVHSVGIQLGVLLGLIGGTAAR